MAHLSALSTLEHYHAHLYPIIETLRLRGHHVDDFTTWRNGDFAQFVHPRDLPKVRTDLWLTAGAMDAKAVAPAATVYVEHGAGQTYSSDPGAAWHESYSNGTIPNAVLYLCPNFVVQARRQRTGVPSVMCGSPRLDAYPVGYHAGVDRTAVAFAWHWGQEMLPETMSAFDHYLPGMVEVAVGLRRRGFLPVAHAHPRIAKRVRWHLERCGFVWWDVDDVLTKAAVLVADTTSLLYEFAHVDRPIVVMNAPWYRKDVHHGLRFWELIPGPEVENADEVIGAVVDAVNNDPFALERARCAETVFPLQDGRCAERAAAAVELVLAGRLSSPR